MRKSESLRIYGYLSRGAYRRVKKQHASPRMTKNLRQPYECRLSSGFETVQVFKLKVQAQTLVRFLQALYRRYQHTTKNHPARNAVQ